MKHILTFLILLSLITACSKDLEQKETVISDVNIFKKDYITIGTFNLEWLGDGHRDRKIRYEEDYHNIANIIKDLDVDIIGLQEIENEKALKRLLKYLPNYTYVIGTTGDAQKPAILFRKSLAVTSLGDYFPLMIEPHRTKAGLWIYVQANNFDFHLMNLHFKSTSHWDNTPAKRSKSFYLRKRQAEVLENWADSILENSKEKDVIVIGDFNDALQKKNSMIKPISKVLNFITEDEKSCRFRYSYSIDNIAVSDTTDILRYKTYSVHTINLNYKYSIKEVKGISDHCPVVAEFDVSKPDNDPPINIIAKK